MVHVGDKQITKRQATAKATMFLGEEIIAHFNNDELITKKGPVFQTAIIAGIQAVKKTSEIIPMCHPLMINAVDIEINIFDFNDNIYDSEITIEFYEKIREEITFGSKEEQISLH